AAAGARVTLLGRPWLLDLAPRLRAVNLAGDSVEANTLSHFTTNPDDLADADICLVTVKSADTVDAAKTLRDVLRRDAVVVSFQNGLRSPERLRGVIAKPVVGGVVTYNVSWDDASLVQATR